MLDILHGATIEYRGTGLDMNAELLAVADGFAANGRTPYAIPGGGSNATGALGYVNCALELLGQMVERGRTFDHMVTATGSAGTQAGLIVGLRALNAQLPLLGIGVRAAREVQEGNQGGGGADRPDPQGGVRGGPEGGVSAYRRGHRADRIHPCAARPRLRWRAAFQPNSLKKGICEFPAEGNLGRTGGSGAPDETGWHSGGHGARGHGAVDVAGHHGSERA